MNAALDTLSNGLLAALINGAYQGVLLVLLVAVALKLNRHTNAATRHAILLVTMVVVAALPFAHWFSSREGARAAEVAGPNVSGPPDRAADHADGRNPVASTDPTGANPGPGSTPFERSGFQAPPAAMPDGPPPLPIDSQVEATPVGRIIPDRTWPDRTVTGPDLQAGVGPVDQRFLHWVLGQWSSLSRLLLAPLGSTRFELPKGWALYAIGFLSAAVAALLVRLAGQFCFLNSLKNAGEPIDKTNSKLFESLCVELKMTRNPRLLVSDQTETPLAAGFLRPAVLLPRSLLEHAESGQLRDILRHELAHLARFDDWANLLQQVIRTIFFFNPVMGLLSRWLTLEREIACDDHVLASVASPRGYALFLTEFAGRPRGRQLAAATAGWTTNSQLKERIDMILNPNRNASPRLARARTGVMTAAAVLVALVALRVGPRVVLAASDIAPTSSSAAAVQESTDNQDASADVSVSEIAVDVAPDVIVTTRPVVAINSVPQVTVSTAPEVSVNTVTTSDVRPTVSINQPVGGRVAFARADSSIDSIEGGPRPKPAPRAAAVADVFAAPAPAEVASVRPVPPLPALPPVAFAAATPPGALPAPPEAPVPPAPPRAEGMDNSIERRLERLERLVDSLANREKKKRAEANADAGYYLKRSMDERAEAFALSDEQKAKIKQMAEEAAREGREAERAAREAQREVASVRRNLDAQLREKLANADVLRDDTLSAQLQALEAQRRALEGQMRGLEGQMRGLERQLKHIDENKAKLEDGREHRNKGNRNDNRSEDSNDKPSDPIPKPEGR